MGIFFGRETRDTPTFYEPPIPPYLGAPMGSGSAGTFRSTPDRALTIPTVWACVGLLANSVSMLPLETFRRTAGVPQRITDPAVVSSPSAGLTQSEWLHMLMVSLLLRGNAYGVKSGASPDNGARDTQVTLVNPDVVTVDRDRDTGEVTYKLGQTVYPADRIWHVKGLTLPGAITGLSPIAYAAATLGIDASSRAFASDFFTDGAHPSAILTTTQQVNQDQANTIKKRFTAAIGGSREPAVLGAGVQYVPIQVAPNESQFLETLQANVAQIARFFWIPAEMVGGSGGDAMTYANVEQRSLDFLTYGVSFWLKRIEDAVFTLLPQPQYVRFNTAALLRTDAKTEATVESIRVASKVIVPSEVRASHDLPPMTDDQKAEAQMVPLTVTPKGGVKALAVAGVAPPDSTDPEDQSPPKLVAVRAAQKEK